MQFSLIVRTDNIPASYREYLDVILDNENVIIKHFKVNDNLELSEEGFAESDYLLKSQLAFPISSIANPLNTYCIYFDIMGNLVEPINARYVMSSRNGYSLLHTAYSISDYNAVLLIKRDENKLCILAQNVPIKNTNISDVIVHNQIAKANDIFNIVLGNEQDINDGKISDYRRKKVMFELDPNTSLAYMEAQVDILTKIVFSLLNTIDTSLKEGVRMKVPQLEAIETILNDLSLLKVKDVDSCLEEIGKNKAKVREVQKNYYDFKKTINPSD